MKTFLENVDEITLNRIVKDTEDNAECFKIMYEDQVKKYSEGLDNLMKDIYFDCVQVDNPSMSIIQKYYLELTNMIYFMIEKMEKLGIYSDLSSSASKEAYSNSYLAYSDDKDEKGKTRLTVAELQAKASNDAQYPEVVNAIYDRAYKTLKGKVSSAQDMADTLKRILYTMTTEMSLSMSSANYQNEYFKGDR